MGIMTGVPYVKMEERQVRELPTPMALLKECGVNFELDL